MSFANADAGGEHFTKPGYEICWNYFQELNLPVLDYPSGNELRQTGDPSEQRRDLEDGVDGLGLVVDEIACCRRRIGQ